MRDAALLGDVSLMPFWLANTSVFVIKSNNCQIASSNLTTILRNIGNIYIYLFTDGHWYAGVINTKLQNKWYR